ncbi:hypothetical protein [Fluviicola chungangensis]|uniref:Uncharacterized protein n=1 Tax=Fluviicola chungangensis TaxID=2597671 RepID=A0A556N361_9FLAO|nr:hypothetical protein [Fluviicola chungangensis]TSJ46634.1 hypothetical protein FO442_05605 [Fluviicola chungangensis]
MTPHHLIDNRITHLFERITQEFGGLDRGELFIQLETGETIEFPLGLKSEISIILETEISGSNNILSENQNPNADWRIKDLIELNHSESQPYIELHCGLLFTEESVSPHGTGLAGFRSFENLEIFEAFFGKDYQRLSEMVF